MTILIAWLLVLRLYPPERADLPGGSGHLEEELQRMGPWTALEKKSAFLMLLAVGLWMTDFWHHTPAPLIGLGIGLFATLPKIGVLEVDDVRRVNYLAIFFVAAALSTGEVLRVTGALDILSKIMVAWLQPFMHNLFTESLALYVTAFVYHIFLGDEVGMLATSLPPLLNFALAHALNPLTVGMIWTFAVGGKIFIYQSAVLVVGYSYGYFDARDMLRVGAWLTVAQAIILVIMVPLYWPLIGLS